CIRDRLYTPHVVIIAIGQNDAHPENYINTDMEKRKIWKDGYKKLVRSLREKYPKAAIILQTTLLFHDKGWDDCIEEAKNELCDPKVYHFLYKRNGSGTPGHLRISEAEEMAKELSAFINSLGEEVWG
ncbi:MAG: electron transporter RnfD, partial [Oscillospiraceae bacterium]|nr:electron transporter RnfD [Oscillospiraceae bacterium]